MGTKLGPLGFYIDLDRLVINLVGACVSSAKYTRRGVKVVYLGFVGTGGSL